MHKNVLLLSFVILFYTFFVNSNSIHNIDCQKKYILNGISIDLPTDFNYYSENNKEYIANNKFFLTVNKESKSFYNNVGLRNLSCIDYANIVLTAHNDFTKPIFYHDKVISFAYAFYDERKLDLKNTYLLITIVSYTDYFCVNFGCRTDDFNTLKNDLLLYAKSIKIN